MHGQRSNGRSCAMTEVRQQEPVSGERIRPFAELLGALRFLTRLPVPFARTIDPPRIASSMRMFSLVGALIGAFSGALLFLAHSIGVPSLLSAAIACTLTIVMTGALHEDGLADTADGFGGGRDREHRLLIMRDSRIGTYGALALMLALMLRVFAMESLLNLPLTAVILLCAAAASFSRAMMVDLMWASRHARSDGLAVYAGRPSRNTTLMAIIIGGLLSLFAGYQLSPEAGIVALAAGTILAAILRYTSTRLIGGQTGDVCGAVQVTSEIGILITFAAMNN
jgi:adenosylcobinamide-GDP ribazoletransferase